MTSVKKNLEEVQSLVSDACKRVNRSPGEVEIVAVTKFQPDERVLEAADAGLRIFAESRVQAAGERLPALRAQEALRGAEWHFIGHLQTNKARTAFELFDLVQSVDSLRLAGKLSEAAAALDRDLRCFAQVNISQEPQKSGFSLEEAEDSILRMRDLPKVRLEGLMGMAAETQDDKAVRSSFRALRELASKLEKKTGFLRLSMGMSQDFPLAVEEGAHLLRIGSRLFS